MAVGLRVMVVGLSVAVMVGVEGDGSKGEGGGDDSKGYTIHETLYTIYTLYNIQTIYNIHYIL